MKASCAGAQCLRLAVGDEVLVRDRKDGNYYPSLVTQLKGGKCKIHFKGWKSSYDEWLHVDDSRIKNTIASSPNNSRGRTSLSPDAHLGSTSVDSLDVLDERQTDQRKNSTMSLQPYADKDGTGGVPCAMCGDCILNSKIIVCGGCNRTFHADKLCVGIGDQSIHCILTESENGVRYFCCDCRMRKNGGSNSSGLQESLTQLLGMVGALVSQMRNLSSKMEVQGGGALKVHDLQSREVPAPAVGGGDSYISKEDIRHEIREVNEQVKRRKSIILRGFGKRSIAEVKTLFGNVCSALELPVPAIADLRVVGKNDLYRANIEDDAQRLELLASTKRLKDCGQFRHIYISKDLTFRQREELKARRSVQFSSHRPQGMVAVAPESRRNHLQSDRVGSFREESDGHFSRNFLEQKQ